MQLCSNNHMMLRVDAICASREFVHWKGSFRLDFFFNGKDQQVYQNNDRSDTKTAPKIDQACK